MAGDSERGNFVSEWFGYRTYPIVQTSDATLQNQRDGRCPFLTTVTRDKQSCVKAPSYLQNKLGGEISVGATTHSPELSFDMTLVELVPTNGRSAGIGRFGVLEIQTMDFPRFVPPRRAESQGLTTPSRI